MKKLITTNEIAPVFKQEIKKKKILTTNEIQPPEFDKPGKGKPGKGFISTSDLPDDLENINVPCRDSTRARENKKRGK